MSALLTTTMPVMKVVDAAARAEGLAGKVRTIIGGAPVSADYAREIGADAYAYDGANAVERVQARCWARPRGRGADRRCDRSSSAWPRGEMPDRRRRAGDDADGARPGARATAPSRSTCRIPRCSRRSRGSTCDAGAEIIQTNTFGGSPLKLARYGLDGSDRGDQPRGGRGGAPRRSAAAPTSPARAGPAGGC